MTSTGTAGQAVRLPSIVRTFGNSNAPKYNRELKRLLFMLAHLEVQMFRQDYTWWDSAKHASEVAVKKAPANTSTTKHSASEVADISNTSN